MKNSQVRLSQCMIVKNEENNIRRALSWAKEIAFEQIVVDTGSTDRTVEIAEEMGAKVFHFSWKDDFAAAKNYAIEQAHGNWIAFLDADEFFCKEDAKQLIPILEQIMEAKNRPLIHVIRCAWIQIDEKEKPFAISVQDRIFRNMSKLRYRGRIHEQLTLEDGGCLRCLSMDQKLSIFHTGYRRENFQNKGKGERNIRLIRMELEENPDHYYMWSYLGDALEAEGRYSEAVESYRKALEGVCPQQISKSLYQNAGSRLIRILVRHPQQGAEEKELLGVAAKLGYPDLDDPDVFMYLGIYYLEHQKYPEAYRELKAAVERVEGRQMKVTFAAGRMKELYIWLTEVCRGLGYGPETIRYGVTALKLDRYLDGVTTTVLALLKMEPGEKVRVDGTLEFLKKLYDLSSLRDLLYLYKCAKVAGFSEMEDQLLMLLPAEEQAELRKKRGAAPPPIGKEGIPGIPVRNRVDRAFVKWASVVQQSGREELRELAKKSLTDRMAHTGKKEYQKYVDYYNRFPFWGSMDPEKGNFEAVERRADTMKEHLGDFLWLYGRLEDYRSRQVLTAVLENWTWLDVTAMGAIQEKENAYFDLNLLPDARGEIFVDLGAYIGDTLLSFLRNYGTDYVRYYAYEPSADSVKYLRQYAEKFPNIIVRNKGVGKQHGISQLDTNPASSSANRIVTGGDGRNLEEVEIVSLDEDITEPVTWIKMDVEGAERDALLGAREHIRRDRPKLSVSVYHGYDELWRLPRLIDQMNADYRFYLRYYGGNLIPTEIVLTALPKE